MGAQSESNAMAVLQTRLATITTVPVSQIAWPNTKFVPTLGTPFIIAYHLPAEPFQASLGTFGLNYIAGIFQLSVYVPKDTGRGILNPIVAEIKEKFKRGTILQNSEISVKCRKVWESTHQPSADWYAVPINVNWDSYVEN